MDYLQYFTTSNLNLLGIRELRRLAFAVGVYGSTMYNKQDLIVHIIDVVFGREAPKNETSKGRPNSITKDRTEILNQIVNKIKSLKSFEIYSTTEAMVAAPPINYNTGNEKQITVCGYYEKYDNKHYLRSNLAFAWTTPCIIPEKLVEKYKLREGDKITGCAILDKTGNYVLDTIEDNVVRRHKSFDQLQITKPNKQLSLSNSAFDSINKYTPILKGGRACVYGKTKQLSAWKHEFARALPKDKLVILGSYIAPEEFTELNEKYENVFVSNFGEDDIIQQRNIALGFEKAKRIAEENKEAIIVIWSLTPVLKSFDNNIALLASNSKIHIDISYFRNLCMTAHNTIEGNSITLIAFADNDNIVQSAINEQASEIFTTKVFYKNNQKTSSFPLDKEASYSLN